MVFTYRVVPRPNGKVRICGDLIQLNKAVLRENHPMPTTGQTLRKLARAKAISELDANSGSCRRKLKDSSKLLTTFTTPWGRYCYTSLPFGISSTPEHFQKNMKSLRFFPALKARWMTSSCMGRTKQNTTKGWKLF